MFWLELGHASRRQAENRVVNMPGGGWAKRRQNGVPSQVENAADAFKHGYKFYISRKRMAQDMQHAYDDVREIRDIPHAKWIPLTESTCKGGSKYWVATPQKKKRILSQNGKKGGHPRALRQSLTARRQNGVEARLPTECQLCRPRETAAGIVDNVLGQEGAQESVTLYELCCGRSSALCAAARKLGCAAMRITKPRRWRGKRQRRRTGNAGAGGARQSLTASSPPAVRRGRIVNYGLDVDNPVHRVRLLSLLANVRPAQGTRGCHLHSSFPCKDFCGIHSLKDAKGTSQIYKKALKRLEFERRVLRAFCRDSDDGSFRISRSYEKSGASRLRHIAGSGRDGRKWPWGISPRTSRARVSSCMVGLKIGDPPTPSAHVWEVQSDHDQVVQILRALRCCRGHDHARTVRPSTRYAEETGESRKRVYGSTTATENYTLLFGFILALAISSRR